jgi:hypothetical protein
MIEFLLLSMIRFWCYILHIMESVIPNFEILRSLRSVAKINIIRISQFPVLANETFNKYLIWGRKKLILKLIKKLTMNDMINRLVKSHIYFPSLEKYSLVSLVTLYIYIFIITEIGLLYYEKMYCCLLKARFNNCETRISRITTYFLGERQKYILFYFLYLILYFSPKQEKVLILTNRKVVIKNKYVKIKITSNFVPFKIGLPPRSNFNLRWSKIDPKIQKWRPLIDLRQFNHPTRQPSLLQMAYIYSIKRKK